MPLKISEDRLSRSNSIEREKALKAHVINPGEGSDSVNTRNLAMLDQGQLAWSDDRPLILAEPRNANASFFHIS